MTAQTSYLRRCPIGPLIANRFERTTAFGISLLAIERLKLGRISERQLATQLRTFGITQTSAQPTLWGVRHRNGSREIGSFRTRGSRVRILPGNDQPFTASTLGDQRH